MKISEPTHRRLLKLMLALFVALGVVYSAATPILEKNDEVHHLAFAIHLANGGGLPIQRLDQTEAEAPWMQEGSQPPLYYWLASISLRFFDTSDFAYQALPNASPQYAPFAPNNKNRHVITEEKRAFNYRGVSLAAFVLRLLGIAPGLVTVWFAHKLASRLLETQTHALVATSLVAFNPMFLQVTTAVSNDSLSIALCTVVMWLLVSSLSKPPSIKDSVVLGAIIGLASLTKLSGALLLPIASVVFLLRSWQERTPHGLIFFSAMCVASLAVSGWWFARNVLLYGELSGTTLMAQISQPRSLAWWQFFGELQGFRMSYLGIFGQTNVPLESFAYIGFDVFLWLIVVGWVALLLRWIRFGQSISTEQKLGWIAIGSQSVLTFVGFARWTMMTPASHGRLWFSCLAGLSILFTLGISEVVRRLRVGDKSLLVVAIAFVALAFIAPIRNIYPAYQPPYITSLTPDTKRVNYRLGDLAEVIGYRVLQTHIRPGENLRVSIYMRALRQPTRDYLLVVKAYGRDDVQLARFDTYTGNGLLPSSIWKIDDHWRDDIDLKIPINAISPSAIKLQFELFHPYSGEIIRSNVGSPLFDAAILIPTSSSPAPRTFVAKYGNFALIEHAAANVTNNRVSVMLRWHSLGQADKNYSVFAHLIHADSDRLVAQSDSPPLNGQYPTSRWAGEVRFEEMRLIDLPDNVPNGKHKILIGLYDVENGARVNAFNSQDQLQLNNAVTVEEIEIR
jgi:4-amino-4-deoxy-L-arabinose transferase-like glycosyltransferase